MRAVFGGSLAGARKIDGQVPRREHLSTARNKKSAASDRIVQTPAAERQLQPISFKDLARFAWPDKTEFFLADCTGFDPRTCRRWLADDTEPPADALGVILGEIMRRYHQRP